MSADCGALTAPARDCGFLDAVLTNKRENGEHHSARVGPYVSILSSPVSPSASSSFASRPALTSRESSPNPGELHRILSDGSAPVNKPHLLPAPASPLSLGLSSQPFCSRCRLRACSSYHTRSSPRWSHLRHKSLQSSTTSICHTAAGALRFQSGCPAPPQL